MYNVLICDDEKDIVNALKIYLSTEGYTLFEAYNGQEALDIVRHHEIHLILMDIMMPQMDGLSAMIELRQDRNIPVILLTAKSEDTDIIMGLHVGADDYITKPFNPVEVLARVKSQLRRYMHLGGVPSQPDLLTIGSISLDHRSKEVYVDDEPVNLTPTEYDILYYFMQHPGQVFSPQELYRAVWKDTPISSENTVAVHIRHLREKIEINPSDPRYLKVVWGKGYKIERSDKR